MPDDFTPDETFDEASIDDAPIDETATDDATDDASHAGPAGHRHASDHPTREFPLSGPINLDVRIGVGAIKVHAQDDVRTAQVELIAQKDDADTLPRTTVEMNGRTLTIRGPKARGWSLDKLLGPTTCADVMAIVVTVPSGTAMKLASYGAQTTVSGRAGSVHIATGAGTSQIAEVDGDLIARFGSGSVNIERVTGSVKLKYGNGSAHLTEVTGPLDLVSGSGSLDVGTAHGAVRVRSGSGEVTIGRAQGDVEIATGSGTLAVGLAPGQPARLDINTGHGRLISELDVSDTAPEQDQPAITIRARTGSGDVRLFRAVA